VFGLGALLLGLVGYLWFRPGPGAAPDMPKRVRKVPELGIFGAGTPPMDRGASQWIAGPEDEADLVRALLVRLARSRAVVVHVPDEAPLPELPGGPVYRLWSDKPGLLVDAVDALLDAHRPPVVLLVGPPPGGLKKWIKAIGEDTAVYTVTRSADEAGGTAVACRRVPGGWQMVVDGREVRLREGPDGLGPV
jgi:hypothetical protein